MLYSQGNLQFNQVINYSGVFNNGNTPCGPELSATCKSSQIWTVPTSKVWKIESSNCLGSVSNNSGWAAYWLSLKINGNIQFPIWLSAGSTLQGAMLGGTVSSSYFLSIVEFNIIP
jgi:hypothetical protein